MGLPASGKSTWAKAKIAEHPGTCKRVSKDDLRAMLDGGKWSRDNEKFILKVRDIVIAEALAAGKHVIVDDTNLAPKHRAALAELAKKHGAALEVVDFTQVSPEECIERDRKRPNYVGEKVIRDMHAQFLAPPVVPAPTDETLPWCVVCDLDGTLALMNGRGPYEGEKCDTDLPNPPVVELVRRLADRDQIIFVSGRFDAVREKTCAWLREHVGFTAPLFMRADGDTREDSIIKREIYEREILGSYNVRFVLDDRNRVVEGWRRLGLTCFQVADGNF